MRHSFLSVLAALALTACSSTSEKAKKTSTASGGVSAAGSGASHAMPTGEPSTAGAFTVPAVASGYTRLTATTITDIMPGADATYCQYLMAPVDYDMDIVDTRGAQSKYGHHVAAFTYSGTQELGKSFPCGPSTEFNSESSASGAAAAAGGHATGMGGWVGSSLVHGPDGAAFRLKKGEGIMLNLHYLNTGDKPIDGDAYLDVKLVETDPTRMMATIFSSVNAQFAVAPHSDQTSSVDCTVQSELQFVMMANHMHEFGVSATTSVVRGGSGTEEVMRDDSSWAAEMQLNPEFAKWPASQPFVVHVGDVIRTRCTWKNTSDQNIMFPREMCISAGFVLAPSGTVNAAGSCNNGSWSPGH
jgi:hypothetical protein